MARYRLAWFLFVLPAICASELAAQNSTAEVSAIFNSIHSVMGGVTVDNGGDVVLCGEDPMYSLDYTQAVMPSNPQSFPDDYKQIIEVIVSRLWRFSPHMAMDLQGFALQVFTNSFGSKYQWRPSKLQLIDLPYKGLKKVMPADCRDLFLPEGVAAEGPLRIQQAVVRRQQKGTVLFDYDAGLLSRLNQFQLAYLLLHEWLWEYTDQASLIHIVNEVLFSEELDQMDIAQFHAGLRGLGVSKFYDDLSARQQIDEFNCAIDRACGSDNEALFKPACDPFNTLVLEAKQHSQSTFTFQLESDLPLDVERLCAIGIIVSTPTDQLPYESMSLQYAAFEQGDLAASTLPLVGFCQDSYCLNRGGSLRQFLGVKDNITKQWKVNLQPSVYGHGPMVEPLNVYLVLNLQFE